MLLCFAHSRVKNENWWGILIKAFIKLMTLGDLKNNNNNHEHFFSDKRGTTYPRNSWNSKDAEQQGAQRWETSTSCKGLCCSFSSPWNDLGVWHFKRDQCGSRISIYLHRSQLITGDLRVVARITCIVKVRALNNLLFVSTSQRQPGPFRKWNPSAFFFSELRELRMTKLFLFTEESIPFENWLGLPVLTNGNCSLFLVLSRDRCSALVVVVM